MTNERRPLAAIFGCAGTKLSADEKRFFRDANPLGFILFARNIETPAATRALVADMRDAVRRSDAPVLIDQEGGRVSRLKPPHWRKAPPAQTFVDGAAKRGQAAALAAVRTNFRMIAAELADLGIDVDCAPVADVPVPGSHDVIGDRAYGADPTTIGLYARAVADGLLAGGVLPVVTTTTTTEVAERSLPEHGAHLGAVFLAERAAARWVLSFLRQPGRRHGRDCPYFDDSAGCFRISRALACFIPLCASSSPSCRPASPSSPPPRRPPARSASYIWIRSARSSPPSARSTR